MNVGKSMMIVFGAVVLYCSAVAPSVAQITPCAQSQDRDARKKTTQAGIDCRQENIDTYLSSLKTIKGKYSNKALQTCLNKMSKELQGKTGRHVRGAGKKYYAQLDQCRKEANRGKLEFSLDSATDDDNASDQPIDADCDDECHADLIKQFMQDNPEPEEAD
jgi:hypothetical protein